MQKQKISLNEFSMLSLIGIGNYAKVILVRKKSNNKLYALKIIKKAHPQKTPIIAKTHAYSQKQILTQCVNPFIIKLHSTFQHKMKLYYVLQYCPGGQLFGLIKRCKRLNQQSTRFYSSQILLALESLHSHKIIYRDLKPQNVMINQNGYIKLVDFGLSVKKGHLNKLKQDKKPSSIVGTPQYMAPQYFVKNCQIGFQVDFWCLGNIIFEMIVGFPPFFQKKQNRSQLKNKIQNQQPPLHLIKSNILKDLLSKLLQKDPKQRLGKDGIKQVKQHQWFKVVPWQHMYEQMIKPPFTPKLKSDIDTSLFDLEGQHKQNEKNSPSDEDLESIQNYQQFSLSWKSSERSQIYSQLHQNDQNQQKQEQASPPEITMKIQQYGQQYVEKKIKQQ